MIFWNVDGAGDGQHLLDKRGCDGNHPLKWQRAALSHIVYLGILCGGWEIRFEVRITDAPTGTCQVLRKPLVLRWIGNAIFRAESIIEEVNIGDMGINWSSAAKGCDSNIANKATCGS